MKAIILVLVILLIVLQYKLWIEDGGVNQVMRLKREVAAKQIENDGLRDRNRALQAEVNDLRTGHAAMEEHARRELGMVKRGETFYLLLRHPKLTQDH